MTALATTITGFTAALAACGGLLAVPIAHGDPSCEVAGPQLDLHHASGYDASIDAAGASLGPGAVIHGAPDQNSQGTVTGGVYGRNVEFRIAWPGTKAYVLYTGTVGDDGFAHGTSTAIANPVNLAAGPWDSTTALVCGT